MHVVHIIVSTYTVVPYTIYRKSNFRYVLNNEFSNSERRKEKVYRLVPTKKGKKVQNRFPICLFDQISRAIAQKNGNLPLYLVPSMDYRNFSNFKSYRKN
jgi:hypothetical protein